MKQLVTLVALASLAVLAATSGTAAAQSTAGQDGLPLYGSNGAWQCNKVRFPKGATSAKILITGTQTHCVSGSCSNATGDGDLYVYATTASAGAPTAKASGWSCRPLANGNEESCSVSVGTSADSYYWACVDRYTSYNTIQLRGEFNLGVNGSTSSSGQTGTFWMDYWKNNLFLSVAYHRFGCFTDHIKIVDERDYDGFSDVDYCRLNYGLNDPATRGGSSTYMVSARWDNQTWQNLKNHFESCGSQTNSYFGTPGYARRSSSCTYNVLRNCNSDCWIKRFSQCVQGSSIEILSPCW